MGGGSTSGEGAAVERSHKQPHRKDIKAMLTQLSTRSSTVQVNPFVHPVDISISRHQSQSNGGGDRILQDK